MKVFPYVQDMAVQAKQVAAQQVWQYLREGRWLALKDVSFWRLHLAQPCNIPEASVQLVPGVCSPLRRRHWGYC